MNIELEEQSTWDELQSIISARIKNAEQGEVSNKTFDQITNDVIQERSEK